MPLRAKMEDVVKTVIIIALIIAVFFFIIKKIPNAKKNGSDSSLPNRNAGRATGCASSLACQNMNLGKAKEAGHDSDRITFCSACNNFTKRTDHCANFYPHGCKNGICAYANNNFGGRCYCKLYQQTVATKASCPDYKDFFDTEIGQGLADSFRS